MARHLRKRAQRIHGVEVAEQENRLHPLAPGKINLDVVGIIFGSMHSGSSAERFEFARQDCSHAVAGNFGVARGFDFDELTDGLHDSIAAGFEVTEAVRPEAFGLFLGSALCFMDCHLLGLPKSAFRREKARRKMEFPKASGTSRTV